MRTAQARASALFPVLASVPRTLPRSARVERFRAAGRSALTAAAARASAPPLAFARDRDGAPRSESGWHWSLSHAEGLVAALVAPRPVGIDVEPLDRGRRANLHAYLAGRDPRGLALLGGGEDAALLLWTALEAALKLDGTGVAGLPDARLEAVEDRGAERLLRVALRDREVHVLARVVGAHALSVAFLPGEGDPAVEHALLAPLEEAP